MRFLAFASIAAITTLLLPGLARADETRLGSDGQFILSAERLFGVTRTTIKDDDESLSVFRVNVFGAGTPETTLALPSPAAIPRLAADWVVGSGVTLGLAAGMSYAQYADEDDVEITHFGVLLAPRVGYVLPIGGGSQLWLRGGVTYFRSNAASESGSSRTWNHVTATLEPTFAIPLGGNTMFTVAPVAEIPLSGRYSGASTTSRLTALSLGLNCGLLAYF
jgi:hypothetical protein